MVLSSSNNYSKSNLNLVETNKVTVKEIIHNGQVKVLLVQLMKGGVRQGIANALKLCGNLTWVRSSNSFDQYNSEEIVNNKNLRQSIHDSTNE